MKYSAGITLLGCQLNEGIMVSSAFLYSDGMRLWSVTHEPQKGIYDLTIDGVPPEAFAAVRDRLSKLQDDEGGEGADVDHIVDIPIELAAGICGYRHDDVSAQLEFCVLRPA